MKKIGLSILVLLVFGALYCAWQVFGNRVKPPAGNYFFIKSNSSYEQVKASLLQEKIVPNEFFFDALAGRAGYQTRIKPGRYEIKGGSIAKLVRMLKAGNQSPVRVVFNKLRTKEDLASKIGRSFEADSLQAITFLMSNDSLKDFGVDSNTVMSLIIPNSYMFYWNGSFRRILTRFKDQYDKFWTGDRTVKAKALGFTPTEIYTIASIVEEETNKAEDKGKIASVYINRMRKGMNLGADPTVKYAMRNFGLKRVLYTHLKYSSPYNTYENAGLPPGPICTASIPTIDAVLNAPQTDYLFFVAKPNFDGYSNFATNFEDHKSFARAYQKALDSLIMRKQNR